MTLFIANDLKYFRGSQIYRKTQNNAGCSFSKANNSYTIKG